MESQTHAIENVTGMPTVLYLFFVYSLRYHLRKKYENFEHNFLEY